MDTLPSRIRLDPRLAAIVAAVSVVGLIVAAILPLEYGIGGLAIGIPGLIGAAYMTTLDVARFTDTSVVIAGQEYPFETIATVDTHEGKVKMIRATGTYYNAIQSSLVLHPPDGGAPRYVPIKNAREGAEFVAETLRAHIARFRGRQGGA